MEAFGLKPSVFTETNLFAEASAKLQRLVPQLKKDLIELGRRVNGSWRSEEKRAALAALIATR